MSDTGKTIALIKAFAPAPEIDPEQLKQDVEDWLDDHPEATTTVQDGAITKAKLDSGLQGTVDSVSPLKNEVESLEDKVIYDQSLYGEETVSLEAGHAKGPSVMIVPLEVPSGARFVVKCSFTSGVSAVTGIYAIYKDGTNSYLKYSPTNGEKYVFTASADIAGFSVYLTAEQVTEDAELTLSATVPDYNNGSIEENMFTKADLSALQPGYFLPYETVNKFNLETATGERMDDNGTITTADGFKLSDYIDLLFNTTGYVYGYVDVNTGKTNCWAICFYDGGKNFISGQRNTGVNLGPQAVPSTARYARVCVQYGNNWIPYRPMFVFGQTKETWVEYQHKTVTMPLDMVDEVFPWAGKKWLSYGDSIVAIGNGNPSDAWQQYVTDRLHFGSQIVRGVGGQTYKWGTAGGAVTFVNEETGEYNSRNDSYNKDNYSGAVPEGCVAIRGCMCSWDRISHMIPEDIKDTIDLIFVMDVNDGNGGATNEMPLFDAENTTDTEWAETDENVFGGDFDITTLEGAIASTLMKLQARCPNALIVTGTSWSGRGEVDGENQPDVSGTGIMMGGEIVEKVSKFFSFNTIDIYHTTQVNPWNRADYVTDTIHPYKDAGKKALARAVISGLRGIMPRFY